MTTYASTNLSVSALLGLSALLRMSARRLRAAAHALDAWLARRRAARAAYNAIHAMSHHQLRDIGLHRYDVERGRVGIYVPGRVNALWI